jgi:hypothetical protein
LTLPPDQNIRKRATTSSDLSLGILGRILGRDYIPNIAGKDRVDNKNALFD